MVTNRSLRFLAPTIIFVLLLQAALVVTGTTTTSAASTLPPFPAGRHDYTSSVDGANLPCSIYLPKKLPTTSPYPVWVDLHSFGDKWPDSETSGTDNPQTVATTNKVIVIRPSGRNYRSLDVNGNQTADDLSIFNDFSSDASNWTTNGIARDDSNGGCLKTTSTGSCTAMRNNASATNNTLSFTISVDLTAAAVGAGKCETGVRFRIQDASNYYWVGLVYNGTKRQIAYRKCLKGTVSDLATADYQWVDNKTYNMKVVVFDDFVSVLINTLDTAGNPGTTVSLKNATKAYGGRTDITWNKGFIDPTTPKFVSGGTGLSCSSVNCSFDNYRIQNEFLYGETDIIDCVQQFLEEFSVDQNYTVGTTTYGPYRADPSRILLRGTSGGGCGTWTLGMLYPDLFNALHPKVGCTDYESTLKWINTNFPDHVWNPSGGVMASIYCEPDQLEYEASKAITGSSDPANTTDSKIIAGLHGYSARYILENALNASVRMEHPQRDTLLPNTTGQILSASGEVALRIYMPASYPSGSVKDHVADVGPTYANDLDPWLKLHIAGMSKATVGLVETSGFSSSGVDPSPADYKAKNKYFDNGYWDVNGVPYGGHVLENSGFVDNAAKIQAFFSRALKNDVTTPRYSQHVDPDDVAYKTYDTTDPLHKHTGAWWLGLDIASQDNPNQPGLARVHRDKANNTINVHVKNVKTTTLDVKRMGLSTGSSKILTVTLDINTLPESEAIIDAYGMTDLKLVGDWYPAKKSQYTVSGISGTFDMTATALTIANVQATGNTKTIAITVPAGVESSNMLPSTNPPGFESGIGNWTTAMGGGLKGVLDLNTASYNAHSGTNSVRIKDPMATAAPYEGSWQSNKMAVAAGKTYALGAFAKTRSFNSIVRAYEGGKYSPASDSSAAIRIRWFKPDGTSVVNDSQAIRNTIDWTPLEATAQAPAGVTQARVELYTKCPNGSGIKGSVWFDDVCFQLISP